MTAWEDVCTGFELSLGSAETMYRLTCIGRSPTPKTDALLKRPLSAFGSNNKERYLRAEANVEEVWTRWRRRMRFVGEMRRILQSCCQDWAKKTER